MTDDTGIEVGFDDLDDSKYHLSLREMSFSIQEEVDRKQYQSYIKSDEVVTGLEYEMVITLENVGESSFPGGTFSNLSWSENTRGVSSIERSFTDPATDIKSCEPGEEVKIKLDIGKSYNSGSAVIKMSVNEIDGKEVVLYDDQVKYEDELIQVIFVHDYGDIRLAKKIEDLKQAVEQI